MALTAKADGLDDSAAVGDPAHQLGRQDPAKAGDGCQHGHAGGGTVDEASGVRHAGGIDPGQAEAQANQREGHKRQSLRID